jgi:hypothetical protein
MFSHLAIRRERRNDRDFARNRKPKVERTRCRVLSHLACFAWLIGLALQAHDPWSAGIIAGVMVALSI